MERRAPPRFCDFQDLWDAGWPPAGASIAVLGCFAAIAAFSTVGASQPLPRLWAAFGILAAFLLMAAELFVIYREKAKNDRAREITFANFAALQQSISEANKATEELNRVLIEKAGNILHTVAEIDKAEIMRRLLDLIVNIGRARSAFRFNKIMHDASPLPKRTAYSHAVKSIALETDFVKKIHDHYSLSAWNLLREVQNKYGADFDNVDANRIVNPKEAQDVDRIIDALNIALQVVQNPHMGMKT
jgi:hypothetical protein